MDFWLRYCELSEVIVQQDGELSQLSLAPGCHFVFGGDAVDKGGGDLAFLRSLLGLKARHPDRVHLILGNRDINKMRLSAELAPENWVAAGAHEGVYWGQTAGPDGAPSTPATFLARQPEGRRADTRAARLRYTLAETMGSPRAFELRRAELVGERAGAEVDDEEVLGSYMCSLERGGLMRRLLQQGQLAARLGDALFVHGAVNARSAGVVPGVDGRLGCVSEWCDALNGFARDEVAAWAAACDAGEGHAWAGQRWGAGRDFFARPGGGLLSYGMAHSIA